MRGVYRKGALALAGLIGVAALAGWSAPASAVDVSDCHDYSSSTASRFDITGNIVNITSGVTCLTFPRDAIVYMNGWTVTGPGVSNDTSTGLAFRGDGFVWGPGILKSFGTCVGGVKDLSAPPQMIPPDEIAVENVIFNQCGRGIRLGRGYKVREVRIHDCHPSNKPGYGMILGQGGFVESSIIHTCEVGVLTLQNNKIWELVVTGHSFIGLSVGTHSVKTPQFVNLVGDGTAVSRSVISHPSSSGTIGIYYNCAAGIGCQDGSNSVDGHVFPNNIKVLTATSVITQGTDSPIHSATQCGGVPATKTGPGYLTPDC